jgi:hypothetical protein
LLQGVWSVATLFSGTFDTLTDTLIFVTWVFNFFALTFLDFTVYNDYLTYREAIAAGKSMLINSVFGVALVMMGTPIYFFYWGRRHDSRGTRA